VKSTRLPSPADQTFKKSEVLAIAKTLEDEFDVEIQEQERLSAEVLIPYLLIAFGLIAGGFFSQVGADIWNAFKAAVGMAVKSKNEATIVHYNYNYEKKEAELEVSSKDPDVIDRAFDLIESTTDRLVPDGDRYYFKFENGEWKLASVE